MKQTLVLLGLLFGGLSLGFNLKSSKDSDQIQKPPIYKKGTFWKETKEQLTTYTGQKINHRVNMSCYIDKEFEYKGLEVYESTVLNFEEKKVLKIFIEKTNLRIVDAIGMWNNYNDTMVLDFKLLNFPLYKGKKWKSICKYQEFPRKPITRFDGEFEVSDVQDSVVVINDQKIKTKAFFLTGSLINDNKILKSDYIYLAPTQEFPGTCPVFLWQQFFKGQQSNESNNKITRRYTLTDFNW
jgi:hypothetical protein